MRRIFLVIMFGLFALVGLYMAATSERVAVGFVYVLLTTMSVFLAGYFTFENKHLL